MSEEEERSAMKHSEANTAARAESRNATGNAFADDASEENDEEGQQSASCRRSRFLKRLQQLSVQEGHLHPRMSMSCDNNNNNNDDFLAMDSSDDDDSESLNDPDTDFCSPPESQVSVGSVAPTLTAALLQPKHYDLTPVMRNTSSGGGPYSHQDEVYATVSAEDVNTTRGLLSLPVVEDEHPCVGVVSTSTMPTSTGTASRSSDTTTAAAVASLGMLPPIPFPPSRKFYSFTSREQYQEALEQEQDGAYGGNDDLDLLEVLTPYQPNRDQVLGDYGSLPSEELDRIFISRGRHPGQQHYNNYDESHNNHRMMQAHGHGHGTSQQLLQAQLDHHNNSDNNLYQNSFPSLHMANQLYGSSTASNSLTDEEDATSVSSRGSIETGSGGIANVTSSSIRRRNKHKHVFEWLESVEADHHVLAEAASSKFLTQQQQHHHVPYHHHNHQQQQQHHRRASAVADESLASC